MAADLLTWSFDQCKKRQKVLRSKVTSCHNRIKNIVTKKLSRRDSEKQLYDARGFLGELDRVQDRLLELLDEEDHEAQINEHTIWAGKVDDSSSLVESYLLSRHDDVSSVIMETPADAAKRQAILAAEDRLRDARAEFETAKQALTEATKAVTDLGGTADDNDDNVDFMDSCSHAGDAPKKKDESVRPESEQAADSWIDVYVSGREKPIPREKGDKSSVSVQLEVYAGRSLDWFAWIGMFYALVHSTRNTPSEKFAILKNHLRGELLDIVHGHGGGESGYKEALQRHRRPVVAVLLSERRICKSSTVWNQRELTLKPSKDLPSASTPTCSTYHRLARLVMPML